MIGRRSWPENVPLGLGPAGFGATGVGGRRSPRQTVALECDVQVVVVAVPRVTEELLARMFPFWSYVVVIVDVMPLVVVVCVCAVRSRRN
jgi:hypothetical protein